MAQCEHCGAELEGKRAGAKYCSSSCRVAAHRKQGRVDAILDQVTPLLEELSSYAYDDELSYDSCVALSAIKGMLHYYSAHDASSWWRCRSCGTAVRRDLPERTSCRCESPQWVLQKTMI